VRVYVAGALGDSSRVREVHAALLAAGHELTLDWTSGPDADLRDYAAHPVEAGRLARADLDAVASADAVVLVVGASPGRGMYVEFGAALMRAERGELEHLVVLSSDHVASVFFFHPAVARCTTVEESLAALS
jgi:hypothetical protein